MNGPWSCFGFPPVLCTRSKAGASRTQAVRAELYSVAARSAWVLAQPVAAFHHSVENHSSQVGARICLEPADHLCPRLPYPLLRPRAGGLIVHGVHQVKPNNLPEAVVHDGAQNRGVVLAHRLLQKPPSIAVDGLRRHSGGLRLQGRLVQPQRGLSVKLQPSEHESDL